MSFNSERPGLLEVLQPVQLELSVNQTATTERTEWYILEAAVVITRLTQGDIPPERRRLTPQQVTCDLRHTSAATEVYGGSFPREPSSCLFIADQVTCGAQRKLFHGIYFVEMYCHASVTCLSLRWLHVVISFESYES